jgi:general secretion pathway protein J
MKAGFTLLEVMVALVVLGFLLAGLSAGTRFGLSVWHRQTLLQSEHDSLEATERLFRALVADTEPPGDGDGPALAGFPDRVTMLTRVPVSAILMPHRNVVAELAVDGGSRLAVQLEPMPHAQKLGQPRRVRETLLDGVVRIELAYWQPAGGWVRAWTRRQPPVLVRLRIVFPPGDRRHWPDIMAATMRESVAAVP